MSVIIDLNGGTGLITLTRPTSPIVSTIISDTNSASTEDSVNAIVEYLDDNNFAKNSDLTALANTVSNLTLSGGGEIATGIALGSGLSLYKTKTGSQFEFRSLQGTGGKITTTLSSDGNTVSLGLNINKSDVGLLNVDNTADINKPISTAVQNALDTKPTVVDGKIPTSYLPSYVSDIIEYASLGSFPATGSANIIYKALDTGIQYRWSGSTYTSITAGTVQSIGSRSGVISLTDLKSDLNLNLVKNVDQTNPSNIVETTAKQFVSATEKSTWGAKQDPLSYDAVPTTGSLKIVRSGDLKTVLEGFIGTESPTFTGIVTLPAVSAADNSLKAATTAFVKANAYQHPDHSGDVTSTGDGSTTISALAVTDSKLATSIKIGDLATISANILSNIVGTTNITNTINALEKIKQPLDTVFGISATTSTTTTVNFGSADTWVKRPLSSNVTVSFSNINPGKYRQYLFTADTSARNVVLPIGVNVYDLIANTPTATRTISVPANKMCIMIFQSWGTTASEIHVSYQITT